MSVVLCGLLCKKMQRDRGVHTRQIISYLDGNKGSQDLIHNDPEPLKFEVDQTEVHIYSYMGIPCRQ